MREMLVITGTYRTHSAGARPPEPMSERMCKQAVNAFRADIDRAGLGCFENADEAAAYIEGWKAYSEVAVKAYVQGAVLAPSVIAQTLFASPEWQRTLHVFDVDGQGCCLNTRNMSNVTRQDLVYLTQGDGRASESGAAVRHPAGFSLSFRKERPELFRLVFVVNDDPTSIDNSKILVVMPRAMLPASVDTDELVAQGLRVDCYSSLADIDWVSLTQHREVAKIVGLLLNGGVCSHARGELLGLGSRSGLVENAHQFACRFFFNDTPSVIRQHSIFYRHSSEIIDVLQQTDPFAHTTLMREDIPYGLQSNARTRQIFYEFSQSFLTWKPKPDVALPHIQPVLQEYDSLLKIIAAESLVAVDMERVITPLCLRYQELCQICGILSSKESKLADPLAVLLEELLKQLPWIFKHNEGEVVFALNRGCNVSLDAQMLQEACEILSRDKRTHDHLSLLINENNDGGVQLAEQNLSQLKSLFHEHAVSAQFPCLVAQCGVLEMLLQKLRAFHALYQQAVQGIRQEDIYKQELACRALRDLALNFYQYHRELLSDALLRVPKSVSVLLEALQNALESFVVFKKPAVTASAESLTRKNESCSVPIEGEVLRNLCDKLRASEVMTESLPLLVKHVSAVRALFNSLSQSSEVLANLPDILKPYNMLGCTVETLEAFSRGIAQAMGDDGAAACEALGDVLSRYFQYRQEIVFNDGLSREIQGIVGELLGELLSCAGLSVNGRKNSLELKSARRGFFEEEKPTEGLPVSPELARTMKKNP